MQPSEEFLKRAAECEQMAKTTRDKGSKATWKGMADRWYRCAAIAKTDSLPARNHAAPSLTH